MKGGLRARMLAAGGLLALIVAAVFAVLLLSIRDLRDSAEMSRHSEEVIATANGLEKIVLDLQTGQRGFVITGQERFLEPWQAGLVAFPRQAGLLERLVSDNPRQEARARAITRAGRSYITQWSRPLVETARRDLPQARTLVAGGEGKRLLDAIRTQFDRFLAAEDVLLAARRSKADASADRAVAVGAGGLAGSVLLILLFVGYLTRAIVAPVRRISAAAGQLAGGDLSARVADGGGGEVAELGRSFNAMAATLQESRDELESQNLELELQAAELEEQRETLDSERRRLEAVLEQMVGGVVIAEAPSGRIVLANKQGEQILGQPVEAESVEDYQRYGALHPDGQPYEPGESPTARAILHGETARAHAMDYRHRDGSIISLEVNAAPIRDLEGRVVAAVTTFFDVTERKRAEEAIGALNEELEAQRLELDRFFTLSLGMLGIAGLDGFFKRLNPAFEQTLGFTVEELVAEPFIHFVHPDDREATLAEVEKLSRGLDTVSFENRYRCKDGSYRWLLWSATAVPQQGLIYVGGRDITERKEADERVRALNEELERQNSELGLSAAELEERQAELELVNDELEAQRIELERAMAELAAEKDRVEAFYRFADRLASEIQLEPFAQLALDEVCDLAQAEIGTLYALGDEERGVYALAAARGADVGSLPSELVSGAGLAGRALAEQRRVAASHGETGLRLAAFGEDVAVHHELHLPLVHAGRVVGVLTLARVADRPFSRDELATIDHLADQAAVVLSSRLALEQARRFASVNRAVLDATLDGIRLVDLEGRTLLANAEIERLTTDVFGLPAGSTLPERSALIAEQLVDPASYLAAEATIAADPEAETQDEFQLARARRWFRRYTAPVRDASGGLIGRIIVVRETTSEREAERLKSELVATVSHELRTPLTGVMGFAELLAKQDVDEETRKRYLETIYGEAKRLTALVNDFLDLQRIEAGGFGLSLEPFELGELLSQEVELYSVQSEAHTLELLLPEEPLVVQGERDRIGQVLGNLVSNAIKYSPDGGPVRVTLTTEPDVARVTVQDTGLGIPADQQGQVFARFFRVDSSDTRTIGGTGLGLALSKEIVEAHGGRIGFESVEGVGSTFWFELPQGRRENGTGRRRVLVVEDDPAAALLFSDYLAQDGYAVETATTGEQGLARAVEDPPALVCLDIGLPGELDGWQVLEGLKSGAATAHVPVLVCTAGNGRDRAAALGAADFLTKPIALERLRQAVARLVRKAHAFVLVVDDDQTVRRLVIESLAPQGYETCEASDGEEALAEIDRRRPDAIVLDLAMPRLDGFAVLERLQQRPETRLLPVVVLTARRLSAAERRLFSERAVSVLKKSSFSQHELRRLVQQAIG